MRSFLCRLLGVVWRESRKEEVLGGLGILGAVAGGKVEEVKNAGCTVTYCAICV